METKELRIFFSVKEHALMLRKKKKFMESRGITKLNWGEFIFWAVVKS